jgi:hypothetical protein
LDLFKWRTELSWTGAQSRWPRLLTEFSAPTPLDDEDLDRAEPLGHRAERLGERADQSQ